MKVQTRVVTHGVEADRIIIKPVAEWSEGNIKEAHKGKKVMNILFSILG